LATADLLPYDEFLQSRSYLEWARPQGLVDVISAALEKSTTSAAMYGVFRHERRGLTDEEARRRMRLLVPDIRPAVLIAKVIDLKQAEAAMLAQTLDGLRTAMIHNQWGMVNSRIASMALARWRMTARALPSLEMRTIPSMPASALFKAKASS
jgi:hypothetical protein